MSKKTIVVAHIHEYELSDVLDDMEECYGEINDETQAEMPDFIDRHFADKVRDTMGKPIYYICDEGVLIDTSVYTFDLNEAIEMAGWVE